MKLAGGLGKLAQAGAILFATLVTAAAPAADGTDDFRILYFESLKPLTGNIAASGQLKADDPLATGFSFDAYGRRFELALERNSKLVQDPATTAIAYRGAVVQQPGSWARLTSIGDELHGMIWDGADLYIIEPANDAREFVVAPLDPAQAGNLIYRLSDTLVDLGPDFCSAIDFPAGEPADGLASFKALTSDLKMQAILQQAPGAEMRLRLSALGDPSFLQRYASDTEARNAILVRLNNVDGIFSTQLGVEIQVSNVTLYGNDNNPFTGTTDAAMLLNELGLTRSNTPVLRADGLTHLFTGRNLDGDTVGLGYIDALCRSRYGAALTETRGRGEAMESLITAHEIGHNFGAIHDGIAECRDTLPERFIMTAFFPAQGPEITSFSQCSLVAMSQSLAGAACLTSLPPADATVAFATPPTGLTNGQSFNWSVTVTNAGVQQAAGTTLSVTLPAGITVEDATVTGGSCSSGAGTVQCALGPVPGNESRTVVLQLRVQASGLSTVTALAAATNENNTANNSASAVLAVDAAAPVVTTPSAPATGSGGGGGGGGSMQLLWLMTLGPLVLARRRRKPAA